MALGWGADQLARTDTSEVEMDGFSNQQLLARHPTLLRDVDSIDCGDGWLGLLDALCARLQFHTDHGDGPQVRVVQVKEKFGVLRFYVEDADEVQQGMIDLAQALSERTCEVCGALGRATSDGGVFAARCPVHARAKDGG